MGGGDIHDPTKAAFFHTRQRTARGVKRRGEINGDDGIPALDWKCLHR